MSLLENIFISLFGKKTQSLVDRLRAEPEMAEAIDEFKKAKISLKKTSEELEIAHKRFEKYMNEKKSNKNKTISSDDISSKKNQYTRMKEKDNNMFEKIDAAVEKIMLAKLYCFYALSATEGYKDEIKYRKIVEIIKNDSNNLKMEHGERLTFQASEIYRNDSGENKVNERLTEYIKTLTETLSEKEKDQFIFDIALKTIKNDKIDQDNNILVKIKSAFVQARQQKMDTEVESINELANKKVSETTNSFNNDVNQGVRLVEEKGRDVFDIHNEENTGTPTKETILPQVNIISKNILEDKMAIGNDDLESGEGENNEDENIEHIGSNKTVLISTFLQKVAKNNPLFKPTKGKTYGHENAGNGCLFAIGVMKDKIGVEFVSKGKLPARKVMDFVNQTGITSKKMFGKYDIVAGPGHKNPTHIRVDGYIPFKSIDELNNENLIVETLNLYSELKKVFGDIPIKLK